MAEHMSADAIAAREAARNNGRFGNQERSAPESGLTPTPSFAEQRAARRAERKQRELAEIGDVPFATQIAAIRGLPVSVPSYVGDRQIVGESRTIDRMLDGPMDGERTVVYDDGTTSTVWEKDIRRALPPVPHPGDRVERDTVKADALRPGDVLAFDGDDGPYYRQVYTCTSYTSIENFSKRIDVVYADTMSVGTYMSVPVEIVKR